MKKKGMWPECESIHPSDLRTSACPFNVEKSVIKISQKLSSQKLTSSRRSTAFSVDAGRGTDKEGPGSETLDNRLFLTPEQLFGILKAQRLW